MFAFFVKGALAENAEHTFSANVGLFSDYLYRGITQTLEGSAVQGGFDYSHAPTGIYAGVWASNVDFGADGDGVYVYGGLDLSLPQDLGLSFYVGYQDVEGDQSSGPAGFDYVHYSIGLSRSFGPVDLGVSWNDANDDCDGASNEACQAIVFSISNSF